MARKINYVALIGILLISYLEEGVADWTSDLTSDINRMTQDISAQVESFTNDLQRRIHQNVENSLRPALAQVNREVNKVNKLIENLPRDAHGHIITNNDSIISINSGNGVSRTVMSGRTPDGEPYVRDIEERYQGNVLYHNETTFNPKTRATERIRWKLDLATPGAKPEIITDEN